MSRWGFIASIFSIISAFCVLLFIASYVSPVLVQKLSDLDAKRLAHGWASSLRAEFDLPGEMVESRLDLMEYLVDQFLVRPQTAARQNDIFNPAGFSSEDHFGTVFGYAVFTRFGQLTIAGGRPVLRDLSHQKFSDRVHAVMRDRNVEIFELSQIYAQKEHMISVLIPLERLGMSRGVVSVEIDRNQIEHLMVRGVQFASQLTSVVLVFLAFFVLAVLSYWGRQQRIAERQAIHLADYDSLTGLPNRRKFRRDYTALLNQARWEKRSFSVISLDVDEFKKINDHFGHEMGDELLVEIGVRLNQTLGHLGQVYRLSGDEFIALCWADGAPTPLQVTTEFVEAMQAPISIKQSQCSATLSVGMARFPRDHREPNELIKCADLALYAAKAAGRGKIVEFEQKLQDVQDDRFLLQRELELALETQSLELAYQPLVSAHDQHILGFEALCRWPHPRLGAVSPSVFIPLAEETGLIEKLTFWVMRTACRAAKFWPKNMTLAVNISPLHLRNENFVQIVSDILAETEFPAHRLELEITESVFVYDTVEIVGRLQALRDLGVLIAMDDFGTGYSSLNYLTRLPISKLKIDKSFVGRLGQDSANDAVVHCVVGLGKSLGIEITAEGVETHEQVALLNKAGCDSFQGYLFGRPTYDPVAMALDMSVPTKRNQVA